VKTQPSIVAPLLVDEKTPICRTVLVNKHTGWTVTEKQGPKRTAITAIQPADQCSSRILWEAESHSADL